MSSGMPSAGLMKLIQRQYRLPWRGIHGVGHWARVLENGSRLAVSAGARLNVVRFFAVFHDCGRCNEDHDPDHGKRGADFAASLRGIAFEMSDQDFELLRFASVHHTDGKTDGDVTVQTCWDADRLDLGRVGIKPHPSRLCTPAAKDPETIAWAYTRSINGYVPGFVSSQWEV
jgi:uncharacterized protein